MRHINRKRYLQDHYIDDHSLDALNAQYNAAPYRKDSSTPEIILSVLELYDDFVQQQLNKQKYFLHEKSIAIITNTISHLNKRFEHILLIHECMMFRIAISKDHTKYNVYCDRCDEENPSLHHKEFDLIISHMSLHFANDIKNILAHYHKILTEDGIFIGNVIASNTLGNIKDIMLSVDSEQYNGATLRIMPMISHHGAISLLQFAQFTNIAIAVDEITIQYKHFHTMIDDIRQYYQHTPSTDIIDQWKEKYLQKYKNISEIYEILTLSGSK